MASTPKRIIRRNQLMPTTPVGTKARLHPLASFSGSQSLGIANNLDDLREWHSDESQSAYNRRNRKKQSNLENKEHQEVQSVSLVRSPILSKLFQIHRHETQLHLRSGDAQKCQEKKQIRRRQSEPVHGMQYSEKLLPPRNVVNMADKKSKDESQRSSPSSGILASLDSTPKRSVLKVDRRFESSERFHNLMAVDIRNDELVKQLSAPTRFAMPRLYESPQATSLPPPPQGWKQSHPPVGSSLLNSLVKQKKEGTVSSCGGKIKMTPLQLIAAVADA